MEKWPNETENIIKQVISVLDPQDLPYQTHDYNIKKVLDIPEDKAKQIYDSIPKTEQVFSGSYSEKRGISEVVSSLGYRYKFIAVYNMLKDRTKAYEELSIERRIPSKNFCACIYDVYKKRYKAPPVVGDFETLANRIILRLKEDESKDKWTLGGSKEADAEACFERIPKEKYDTEHHTSARKGSRVFVGKDGLEYVFTAEISEDCGGSEWYVSGSLKIECTAIGLCKQLYSYSYYSR